MKKILVVFLVLGLSFSVSSQTFTANETPVGLEHNMLFNANSRYSVSQTGGAPLHLNTLFDGKMAPSYTSTAPTQIDPTVIVIDGLSNIHTQVGSWVGWATRYWQPIRFKIEGYDAYLSSNTWKVLEDYSTVDYTGGRKFVKKITPGSYTKLRFTFYTGSGSNGRLGISELFFIHPEATSPYQGLFTNAEGLWSSSGSNTYYSSGNVGVGTTSPENLLTIEKLNSDVVFQITRNDNSIGGGNRTGIIQFGAKGSWGANMETAKIWAYAQESFTAANNGTSLRFFTTNLGSNIATEKLQISPNGNIGIGTTTPDSKLTVAGNVHAQEVKVTVNAGADFVFDDSYQLPTLGELDAFIKANKHLPEIATAIEMETNGLELGKMNIKLLQKIEELTLYTIEQENKIQELEKEKQINENQDVRINKLELFIKKLLKEKE